MVAMLSMGSGSLEPPGHRHCKERFHLIADMDAAGTDKQVVIDHLSDKAKYDFGLISRALDKHDQAAFAELMERYREPIYYMLLKMVNCALLALGASESAWLLSFDLGLALSLGVWR